MCSKRLLCLSAVLAVLALLFAPGCRGPEKETAVEKPGAKAKSPAVSAALQKALVEVVSLAPADAVAVGTVRSPRALVDDLNALVGPELASVPGVALSLLPAGALDMDGPAAWLVLLSDDGPAVVVLMRVKEASRLKGDAVAEGILRVRPDKPEICATRVGSWAAFGSLGSVMAFKAAASAPRLAVDEKMAGRIGEELVWIRFNAKPLAAMAKPGLQEMKKEAERAVAAGGPATDVKAAEWLENLLDQLDALEVGLTVDGDRLLARAGLTVSENASLLAIARAMKPLDQYEASLPETDRFLLATWGRMDYPQAVSEVKTFLKPAMDFIFEKLGQAAARAGPSPGAGGGNPMDALRKALEEQWSLADEYKDVMGDRFAALMEIPERGQGFYRLTETVELKDAAKYLALVAKSAAATQNLLKAISGQMPQGPGQPQVDMSVDYKPAAETIEGLAVDVMRIKIAMHVPEDVPPEVRGMMKGMTDTIYGPEGMVMRMAVCNNRALAVIGGQELMGRAIKRERGQAGDLAKQRMIAEALARVPPDSSAVALVSLPAYVFAIDMVLDDALLAGLPPDRREIVKEVPLPCIERAALTAPTVLALRVDGRTIRLDMDMPKSDLSGALPYVRHAYARALFYVFQQVPGFLRPSRAMMPMPGAAPQPRPAAGSGGVS